MINLSFIPPILGLFYNDTFTVYRTVELFLADKSKKYVTNPVPTLTDIKCRVEIKGNSEQDLGESKTGVNPKEFENRIFTSSEFKLLSGDTVKIELKKGNGTIIKTIQGILGEPIEYDTHQEVLFTVKEVS